MFCQASGIWVKIYILDADEAEVDQFLRLMENLKKIAPVYFSFGNHEMDYMHSGGKNLYHLLQDRDITVLLDRYVHAKIGSNQVHIGGSLGHYYGYHWSKKTKNNPPDYAMEESIGKSVRPAIVLLHMPETILLDSAVKRWTGDLYLSGHTHGGVIRIPGIGGLFAPTQGLFPKYDQGQFVVYHKRFPLIITSGLSGCSIVGSDNDVSTSDSDDEDGDSIFSGIGKLTGDKDGGSDDATDGDAGDDSDDASDMENGGEAARTAWLGSFMRLSKSKRYFKDLLDVIKVRQLAVEIKVRDIINRTDSSMFMIYPQEILDYAKKPTVSEEQIEGYIIGKLGGKKQERENRGWFISQYGPNRTTLTAAAAPTVSKSSKVYEVVEEMPSFPGGKPAIAAYIAKTVKYPGPCLDNKIQGRVVCRFTVTKEGTVKDIVVTKSVDPLLDKEAIRVISLMPRWIPGKHNGARVDAKYTLPVTFRLTQTADEDN